MTTTETVAIVSAVTALVAVVVGPSVSIWVARHQSRVTVRAANRQAWINNLRDLISEYISITSLIHAGDWSVRPEVEFDQKMERLQLLLSKVRLMLNPQEVDHKSLSQLLQEISSTFGGRAANGEKRDSPKARELVEQVVTLSQSILKREWERVKGVE